MIFKIQRWFLEIHMVIFEFKLTSAYFKLYSSKFKDYSLKFEHYSNIIKEKSFEIQRLIFWILTNLWNSKKN